MVPIKLNGICCVYIQYVPSSAAQRPFRAIIKVSFRFGASCERNGGPVPMKINLDWNC